LLLFPFAGCRQSDLVKLQTEVARLSSEFAPDARTAICSLNIVRNSDNRLTIKGETTSPEAKREIIKTLHTIDNALIDSILLLPDTILNRKIYGLANLSVINLKKQPNHSSELVSQAILGTPVMILKEKGSWALVQTPDNYIAWTEKSTVTRIDRQELKQWQNADRIIFLGNSGWIFSNADGTGIVSDLVAGCVMVKTGETGKYVAVTLPDGRNGFIEKNQVTGFNDFLNSNPATGDDILNKSFTLMGVPYLWGGSSSKNMDCSGFVRTVYFMNGLILQRDASQQARYGDTIDISNNFDQLKKGDLLFFGSPEHISHVAIYTGDYEYINAAGMIRVNSLDTSMTNYNQYRRRTLVKAVRIIGSVDKGIVPIREHSWYK
jgi:cell wall-associated NlpC family hydrolase